MERILFFCRLRSKLIIKEKRPFPLESAEGVMGEARSHLPQNTDQTFSVFQSEAFRKPTLGMQ